MRVATPVIVIFAFVSLISQRCAAGGTAVGDQFQVNTNTSGNQVAYSVALDADGDFVVVWESYSGAPPYAFIEGQRYASDGTAIGGEFQINAYKTDRQGRPSVAMHPDGGFVVAWDSYVSSGSDSSDLSIQAQRYASDGTIVGANFQVNTYTTRNQLFPSVATDATGDFLVTWQSNKNAPVSSQIQGQRYSSDGMAVGGEFTVNTTTTSEQRYPSVAMTAAGDFVVVWDSLGSSGSDSYGFSIQGQRYASDGTVLGGEFQVNTSTTLNECCPSVALDAAGGFVVAWDGLDPGGSGIPSIQGRRFASDGTGIGGDFQVNTYFRELQAGANVAMDADGDFVVTWVSKDFDGSYGNTKAQCYTADGTAVGGEFLVNTYTTGEQKIGPLAMTAEGDFIVVWTSRGSPGTDTSGTSVQGQRFTLGIIFADGFESGDTSAWE